jgi:nucleoside-diphosphate-sugar epimerase
MTKLIVGCGYLGQRVARRWIAEGNQVAGLVRTAASAAALVSADAQVIVADVTRPSTMRALPSADTLLFAVGYDPAAGESRSAVYVDGLRNVLEAVDPRVRRVILISSTGVYAERAGGWVDESSPCLPVRESGRALLAAEQTLAAHPLGDRGIILRLAGIYGPGRMPRRTELLSGEPLSIAADEYINLIHVEDAARAVLAAEAHAKPPRTYVISDGHPVERRSFFAEIARQVGLPPPAFRDPLPGEAGSRRGGDKRVNNARMRAELPFELAYPSYREGLGEGAAPLPSSRLP